jgi:transcriptional regulator with GAF, ATPase, and Fis domain
MNQTSRNVDLDIRLLEVEELYRQRKHSIAGQKLKAITDSGIRFKGYELGVYKTLRATELFYSSKYSESIKEALEANKLLAPTSSHTRVGRIHLLLERVYFAVGELKIAERNAHDALACFNRSKDAAGMIDAYNALGKAAFFQGDLAKAITYINDAIELARGDNIRLVQLIGNLGRIEIMDGSWDSAENHLKNSLRLAEELGNNISITKNRLSLGYLYIRKRLFSKATLELRAAALLIEKENFTWERVDLLEYEGELAFEQGDIVEARRVYKEAYKLGRELSPDSTLCSQVTRRLAQVEYVLDNLDEALKLAQRALDISMQLGEKAEIGHCRLLIGQILASRKDIDSAMDHLSEGLEIIEKTGDYYDFGRALLIQADLFAESRSPGFAKTDKIYDEAYRIFNRLKLFYWSGETRYRQGVNCCYNSRISLGFKRLLESEQIFEKMNEKNKMRSVRLFKQELSKKAVAASMSAENEFKIFGDYFSDCEYSDLRSGHIEEIINILAHKTSADRVIIYKNGSDRAEITSNQSLTEHQRKKFIQNFKELIGEEFSIDQPTLIMDCRRDPFINELLHTDNGHVVSTVIVLPLSLGNDISGYAYLDRLGAGNNFNPFGQKELNFSVGFADLIALKLVEYERYLLEEDNKRLKAQLLEKATFPNIITQNKSMLEMLARVQQVVNSDISISITGETGSGKDLLAKTIHYNSSRREKRFISVNCAALPETLLESELFGHKKGAFTGADRDKVGLFEEADGGTFFLDEIADMPLSIQAKVLRILEEKEIVRLGETKPIKVDVRIISATNKDLKVEMENGLFRQDLYYRLTALCFNIPPLRERREDIPLLIQHFAGEAVKIMPESMRKLVEFDWPGNVRELENEVKKLILLAGESGVVTDNLLSSKISDSIDEKDGDEMRLNTNVDFNADFSLYDYLAEYERRFIIKALKEQSGVKKHAAKLLNIPESTLRLKIKQYNIDPGNLSAAG